MPRPGQVLGLVGTNGIGKSTAIKVLAGKLKPNLGRFTVRSQACMMQQDAKNAPQCHAHAEHLELGQYSSHG